MTTAGTIVGFYFAEDKLIHCSYDVETRNFSSKIEKEPALENGVDSIKRAAKIIVDQYGDEIVGVGLAVPSAIVGLNTNTEKYGWLGTPLGPRQWQNFNAKRTLVQELKALGRKLLAPAKVAVISQVGATAMGHFERTIRNEFSDQIEREVARRDRHHLYVVADRGIGVASYHRNWLLHGNAVPNIGHFMIARRKGDVGLNCKVHPQRDCLNSFASLDAIEDRWPHLKNVKGDFQECDDHQILSNVAFYIAQAVGNLVLYLSPNKIVMGVDLSRFSAAP